MDSDVDGRVDGARAGTEDVAAHLRAAGLRVTAPRLTAYAVVAATPHCDADAVAAGVR